MDVSKSQCRANNCLERTLCTVPSRYLKYTLDQHVENDYTIVYFHYGLSSQNKPSLGWLQNAYKEFDRKCVQGGGYRSGRHTGTEWRWAGAMSYAVGTADASASF